MAGTGKKYFKNSSELGLMKKNQDALMAKKSEIMSATGGNLIAGNWKSVQPT